MANSKKYNLMLTPRVSAIGINGSPLSQQQIVDRLYDYEQLIQQMESALIKIANYTQDTNLLWWQIEARNALPRGKKL